MTNHESGNRVIAEFMGAEWNDHLACYWFQIPPTEHASHGWTDLQYHTSWEWIIPVVEKIKIMIVDAEHRYRMDPESQKLDYQLFIEDDLASRITRLTIWAGLPAIYESVIAFINWYNTQKTITHA